MLISFFFFKSLNANANIQSPRNFWLLRNIPARQDPEEQHEEQHRTGRALQHGLCCAASNLPSQACRRARLLRNGANWLDVGGA